MEQFHLNEINNNKYLQGQHEQSNNGEEEDTKAVQSIDETATAIREKASLLTDTKTTTTLQQPLDQQQTFELDQHCSCDHHDPITSTTTIRHVRRLLYFSHGVAEFVEITWQFCLGTFLGLIVNYQSLFWVSSYGFVSGLAICLLASTAGDYVDKTNRLDAVTKFLWGQKLAVMLASVVCYNLLMISSSITEEEKEEEEEGTAAVDQDQKEHNPAIGNSTQVFLIVGIHLLGSTASVLYEGYNMAIQRDWIVVLSQCQQQQQQQQQHNDASNSFGNRNHGFATVASDDKDEEGHGHDQSQSVPREGAYRNTSNTIWLTQTNVVLRQIHLGCKIVTPFLSGMFLDWVSSSSSDTDENDRESDDGRRGFGYAVLMVGLLHVLALVTQHLCVTTIYNRQPALAEMNPKPPQFVGNNDEGRQEQSEPGIVLVEEEGTTTTALTTANPNDTEEQCLEPIPIRSFTSSMGHCLYKWMPWSLQIYIQQKETALAGFGLAFLYLNPLTFGSVCIDYLAYRGMALERIGLWKSVASAMGFFGTCVYRSSVQKIGLERTGLWSIVYDFGCLTICFGSLSIPSIDLSLVLLIGGLCASRMGLWIFDTTVTQMQQETVPKQVRGVVGGVQQSLGYFLYLGSMLLGIVFPNPADFYLYITTGFVSVGIAMILFSFGYGQKYNVKNGNKEDAVRMGRGGGPERLGVLA